MIPIKYRSLKKYKYEILEEYRHRVCIHLPANCSYLIPTCCQGFVGVCGTVGRSDKYKIIEIIVKPGYCYDGTSGPTIDTENTMRGSLVHDVLYQMMRESVIPVGCVTYADNLFHQILLEDGMSRFRAWYYFQGVNNWFAHRYARPE